jgi:hypothetical protein
LLKAKAKIKAHIENNFITKNKKINKITLLEIKNIPK